MNLILLSGGSGKRLWPLSNDARSKQFLKLLKAPNGEYESMVQRVYRQIREAEIYAPITIATSISQRDSIINQLGDAVDLVLEPERRDTFPAILLASAYLYSEKNCSTDEVAVVLPVDPYTELTYFKILQEMETAVINGADMALMGITPSYPSEKYGYIVPKNDGGVAPYEVERFTEKPSESEAKILIEKNAVWNGGVFAFKLGYLLEIAKRYLKTTDFTRIRENYGKLPKISFDYEVVEKAKSVVMLPFSGTWKDLGTWNTLNDTMPENTVGCVTIGEETENTHVINELDVPVVVLGAKNMIVAASPDGILVSDKIASAKLKPYVENLGNRPMYEERRWGKYKVIDFEEYEDGVFSLTKGFFLNAGKAISYQKHNKRDEIWTVVTGCGDLVLDGHVRNVRRGDVAYITKGMLHAIKAVSDLRLIEVQIGEELTEEDIERFEWEWEES